ncbi:hypothetical protein TCAL_11599 [Tigriopus californicus]|uniref:Arrestin C-terminal-like domain-containing protein n=1 Tax=Tigriopus californicus TaxID=6832 RepID=A0A553PLW7_TIGCA|nr:arrestin domain-containing protein 4-like [Tigriopus californicus]TRY78670.1 hypothetical protein TCAL_11599 [Tigriopus californicus]|eukprot:TCALIF_11599-PA protein Name:"Similar to ARRDC4 Arrestin domain-containing protein 4 (Homo sapiens)" AED:0.00 eAED:0.00 QI:24/1/1/1/1/1/5/78/378
MPMSLLKDGIDNVVVTFDNESATYRAGTEMTGVIAVFCEDTTPVRGIRLKINGRLNIFWRKIDGGSTIEYTEIEDYLDRDLTVWAPNPKKRDEMWMFPGHHVYPFKFCLPIDLPDTLEDSRYGKIQYDVKAGVYLTQGRVTYSLEEPFHIISTQDPAFTQPTEEEMPKENYAYATIGGTCFLKKTHVELYMKLDQNIFKLGDTIPVHVECRLEGGNADVDKVTVLLVQEAIYTVGHGTKDVSKKKERLVVAEAVDEEDTDVGKIQNYDLNLNINDRMPLTDFPWCDFIDIGYSVHAVARTHSFYDDIVVKLPIIIGPKTNDSDVISNEEILEAPINDLLTEEIQEESDNERIEDNPGKDLDDESLHNEAQAILNDLEE